MKKVMKKSLCALLALAMVCTGLVLPGTEARAATNVSYRDEHGASQTCESATEVGTDTTAWDTSTGGWYVVSGTVNVTDRITVTGDVKLILMNSCTLTASKGISVNEGNSLTIYAQSDGSSMGKLVANGTYTDEQFKTGYAPIGGDERYSAGNITINGGDITATATTGSIYGSAGIGGGGGGSGATGGNITINGGKVTASGGGNAACIGGGSGSSGGTITINGGTVKTNGGNVGIGSGDGVQIKITNGNITTADGSVGIGAKNSGDGTIYIEISGGWIHANYGRNVNGVGIGIPSGASGPTVDFYTGESGNAVIYTNRGLPSGGNLSCVYFDGYFSDKDTVYGDPAPTVDFEVPEYKTLTVPEGASLTIPDGVTMTIQADAKVANNGHVIKESGGTITGSGSVTNKAAETGPACGVSVGAIAFTKTTYGGARPEAKTITITNTGVLATTIKNVVLSGTNAESFTLTGGGTETKLANKNDQDTSWKMQPNDKLGVGTYNATVKVTYTGRNGAEETATAEVSLEVEKAEATVTPPTSKGSLTYNGDEQDLVTEGSVTPDGAGTMKYSLTGGEDYTETIPTGKAADTYTVYWKVEGADTTNYNYGGETRGNFTVTIDKAGSEVTQNPESTVTYIYGDAGGITLKVDVKRDATGGISLASADQDKVVFTFEKNSETKTVDVDYTGDGNDTGTATFTIAAEQVKDYFNVNNNTVTVNYGGSGNLSEGSTTITVTVNKKQLEFTFTPDTRAYKKDDTTVTGTLQMTTPLVGSDNVIPGYTANMDDADAGDGKNVNVTVTLGGADASYYEVGTVTGGTVTISKADITEYTAPTGNTLMYSGDEQELITAGTATGGTMKYILSDAKPDTSSEDWKTNASDIKGQDAKTYTIWYYVEGDENHNSTEPASVTATISKAASEVTKAPTANKLTYTGSEQELVTKGEATGGTLKYALGDTQPGEESFTETIPAETNAGTYYVWYKVVGDKDHEDTEPVMVTAEIKKAASNVTVENVAEATYGDKIELTATVTSGEIEAEKLDGTLTFKVGETSLGTGTRSGNTWTLKIGTDNGELQKKLFGENGTTNVTAVYEGNSNIAGDTSEETSVTVNKRTLTFTFNATDRTYDQTTDIKGTFTPSGLVDGDNVEVSTYTATVGDANVGDGKNVTAEVTTLGGGDEKYYSIGDADGGTVNITQAVLELTVTPVSITYGTKLTDGLLSGSSAKISGTDKVVTGSWKWASEAQDAMPTVGDGGSKTYKVVFTPSTDKAENFTEASLSTEITVSVGKATPTVTVDRVNGTYGENIVITAKVEVNDVAENNITGTVTFEAGGTPLGQAEVKNGTATLTVQGSERDKQHALFGDSGSSNVTATYSGDTNIEAGTPGSGSATVERRALTYEVTATGRDYDGTTKVDVALKPTNLVSGDSVSLTATGNLESANAKTYTQVNLSEITIDEGGDGKYYSVVDTAEGKELQGGVTIRPKVVELDWKLDDKATYEINYDGKAHTVTAEVTNKVNSDDVSVTVKVALTDGGEGTGASVTKAGSYTATATELNGAAANNYKLADPKPTKEITINKIGAEFTAPTAKDLTYNGSSQALVNEGSTDDGTMMYALGENASEEPSAFGNAVTSGTDAGKYYVWYYVAGDGNHKDSEKKCVTVTVKKAVVTFTETNGTTTYDTKPHQVKLTNTAGDAPELQPGDYTVHYAASGENFETGKMDETKAGTYDVWVQLEAETFKNYQFKDGQQTEKVGTLKVEPARLELTVNDVTITYGDALTNELLSKSTAKITGEGGATITGTWAWESVGAYPTVANSGETGYKVTFTPNEQFAGNFVETTLSTEVTITVKPYELTPVVVASSVSDKIYDGNTSVTGGELEFEDMSIFDREPFNGTKPTISGTFAFTSEDAGTNTVNVTGIEFASNGENYSLRTNKIDNATVDGSIQKKMVELTWALDGEDAMTTGYTTTAHTVTATATTGVGEETVNVTVENGTQTNAGTYTATAAGLTDTETGRADNYKLPESVEQEYTIGPAEVSFTIGNEAKADWASYHETNDDPNPEGYKLTGEGTDYVLEMVYDSFYHTTEVKQAAGEEVKIEKKAENGYCVTYKRVKDAEGKDVTEDAIEAVRNAGTYEIWVTINPVSSSEEVRNYVFSGHEDETSLKIGTITVNPYEITVAWTHLSYVYHGHAMHPNITVLNAFKSDLYTGTSLPTNFDPDTYNGNRVIAFGATEGSDVGEYTVTAKLYGANAGNYTVADPDETVNIVPAPVTFTVGDNIWVIDNGTVDRTSVTLRPTWGAVTTDPDTAVHHSYPKPGTAVDDDLKTTIVYKKDGVEYTTPTEAGTYEVWVEIGNKNFRHSATSDGASHNVGELIITTDRNSVRSYTVTFDPDCEGATGPEAMTGVFANQTVVMPAIGFERERHIFQGWSYGGRVYMPNEEFHMPSSDVTFKAQWLDMEDIRSVGGTVKQEQKDDPTKSDPVLGATVTLKQGSNEIGETVTDDEGKFSFENLVPGIYNLEVRYHNGDVEVVKTYLVDVEGDSSLEGEYVLPGGALNTVVEADVTAVVDMESIVKEPSASEDEGIYTNDDAETVEKGGSVEFKMTVKGTEATPEQIEEIPVPEERIGMVLDMELTKTVTDTSGTKTESDIEDTKTPITTVIHLSPELQGKSSYTIYRFHDLGDGNDMQTITTSASENGEYLKVIREGTAIELHARLYSTYVLTWAQRSGGGGSAGLEVELPESVVGGKVSADRPTANPGERVTLTMTASEGFAAGQVHVYTASGAEVEVTVNDDGTYSFTMPNEAVVVTVGFGVDCKKDATCPIWPYTDAAPTQWYHDGVHYVLENGIMDGYGNNIFKPGATLSRAMVAEMLYKMNGRPAVTGGEPFDDVDEGDWYRDAVIWANANGYITGYGDGTFRPETAITREQLATIMLRYERKHSEVDEELVKQVPSLPDAETTGEWYVEGVNWAVAVGIIGGRNVGGTDYLLPASTATRAEAATMVMRWIEKGIK